MYIHIIRILISILISALDKTTFEIMSHLPIPDDKKNDYSYVCQLCKDRFEPATSLNERRLRFRNERQDPKDDMDTFYKKLLKAAAKAFPDHKDPTELDTIITDQFVTGMNNEEIKMKLLERPPKDKRDALAANFVSAHQFVIASRANTQVLYETVGRSCFQRQGGRHRKITSTRTADGQPICYLCGKPNHIAAQCCAPVNECDLCI